MPQTSWPALSFDESKDTIKTLHLFTQVVGKIKLKLMPWINHSWHVVLIVTPNGLTTNHLPYNNRHLQIDFDLCSHQLVITTSESENRRFSLQGISVAEFYNKVFTNLKELDIHVAINKKPNEIPDAVDFDKDDEHKTYNKDQASNIHKALLSAQKVLTTFRSLFKGKCSPVHFFWGSFDLAVTRFSGKKAPLHPGGVPNLPDTVAQEAYSHEVSSCGFWPGSDAFPAAAFYAYHYPEPEGYGKQTIEPSEGYYDNNFKEFILPYDAVQKADNSEENYYNF